MKKPLRGLSIDRVDQHLFCSRNGHLRHHRANVSDRLLLRLGYPGFRQPTPATHEVFRSGLGLDNEIPRLGARVIDNLFDFACHVGALVSQIRKLGAGPL